MKAGDAYYMPPGHRFEALEDVEVVEFSPTAELQKTLEVVSRESRPSGALRRTSGSR